jgi:hypothetical protein
MGRQAPGYSVYPMEKQQICNCKEVLGVDRSPPTLGSLQKEFGPAAP